MSSAVGIALALWLVIAALAATRPFGWRLHRFDPADLLQQWDLFAKPRAVDLVLLRRDFLRDGTLTSWREVDVCGPRRWTDFVWNPDLRARRAYLGMASNLVRDARTTRRQAPRPLGQGTAGAIELMTSREYVSLLGYVSSRSHPATDATQFMLVSARELAVTGRHDDGEGARVAFVSEFHRVDPGRRAPGWKLG